MKLNDLKEQLYSLIQETSNEVLLEDLLSEAKLRVSSIQQNEQEGLSKEDFDELSQLAIEPTEKNMMSYAELKSSLNRWFIN